ncbi:MAG: HtpX2, heat shock protein HtpX, heat shock protein HtpX [Patescibacteria group bacterium]|nr:HtpX2, heat shock protein HtpX, heat shock protein HtpX [Patescibacteria group bacterium]
MYSQIASNKRRSVLLVLGFVFLVGGLDYLFSRLFHQPAMFIPILIGAVIYAFVTYYFSSQIALGMSGAREVQKKDAPELYRIVENLAIAGGLQTPKVYIIDDPSPNAFATGRDPKHAVVAVTSGILEVLDKTELEGVLAHELSHVGNYDIRFMSVVTALVSVVAVISDLLLRLTFWSGGGDDEEGGNNNQLFFILGIVGAILAPLVAVMIQFAVSRQREYLADSSGALLTRYPEGLARALEKISKDERPMQHANSATAPLYISNPLKGRSLAGLFDTHPPIKERIKRLREMKDKA